MPPAPSTPAAAIATVLEPPLAGSVAYERVDRRLYGCDLTSQLLIVCGR